MGRSIALNLAREGAAVVVNYLTSFEIAAAIVAYIEKRGGHAFASQADVTRQDECKKLVDSTLETFGRVDICIIGPGSGWHPEPSGKLDATAALDDVHKARPEPHPAIMVHSKWYRSEPSLPTWTSPGSRNIGLLPVGTPVSTRARAVCLSPGKSTFRPRVSRRVRYRRSHRGRYHQG